MAFDILALDVTRSYLYRIYVEKWYKMHEIYIFIFPQINSAWEGFKGLRPVLEGFCCHNAWGCVRNRKSNPEADRPRDLTYCSHKPECIVTASPDRLVLITVITWHFQFHIMNVSILHLRYEYGARSKSCFACYSLCYVMWCPLAMGIVISQCPLARDAALVTRYLTPLISVSLKPLKIILP